VVRVLFSDVMHPIRQKTGKGTEIISKFGCRTMTTVDRMSLNMWDIAGNGSVDQMGQFLDMGHIGHEVSKHPWSTIVTLMGHVQRVWLLCGSVGHGSHIVTHCLLYTPII